MMRTGEITVPNMQALRHKIPRFAWELYLNPEIRLDLRVRTRKTPLYHSEAVARHVQEGISNRLVRFSDNGQNIDPGGSGQMVLIRIEKSTCSVLIDSSGELLYKRGVKIHGGRAPLRETVAAAMLRWCDYKPTDILIDPMCGTGTFALEAAMRAGGFPPGWFRQFAFEHWPAFRPTAWQHIRRQALAVQTGNTRGRAHAFDIDAMAVNRLKRILNKSPLGKMVQVRKADFFSLSGSRLAGIPGVILINPPYGERLSTQTALAAFYRRVGAKLAASFRGWRLGLVLPTKNLQETLPFSGELRTFYHGGSQRWVLTARIE